MLRIGISGWTYPPWRGTFYPTKLAQRRELEYASRQVNSVEINGSFYSLQTPASYKTWHDQTPEDFVFAVKGGRFITHLKRLKEIEAPLANFFASGLLRLGKKLGPILWQLPPQFPFTPDRLESFFRLLPRDTTAAAALARQHDSRLRERAWTRRGADQRMRHVLEVRHPSFADARFVELLRHYDVGLVIADTAGKFPFFEDVTSDLVYVRLHGDEELYVSGYTEEALDDWARKIRVWARGGNPKGARTLASPVSPSAKGRDVFVYFDNDVKVRAPFDAMSLAYKLGMGAKPGPAPDPSTITRPASIPRPAGQDKRWQIAPRPRRAERLKG